MTMRKRLGAAALALGLTATAAPAAISFEATQDAHLHEFENTTAHDATTVQVKNGGGFARKGLLEFDVTSRSGRRLSSATLTTTFFDTAAGTITLGNNWEFEVYHLADSGDAWDEATVTWNNYTENNTATPNTFLNATSAGTFTVLNQGAGTQTLSTDALRQAIQNDANGIATIGVVRNTGQTNGTYVHGFRSSEFGTVAARPTLSIVEASALVNGEFEDAAGNFSTAGWSNTAGVASGADPIVAGSHASAFLNSAANGQLRQSVGLAASDFMFETYFATESGANSGDRGFNVLLMNLTGSGQINLRVNGNGAVEVFDGGWQTIIGPGTIEFSDDITAGSALDELNVHRLRIVGRNYGTGGAYYDVFLSDANETEFSAAALGLMFWQNNDPDTAAEGGIGDIFFETAFGTGDFIVDAAYLHAIPTPAALPAGLAMLSIATLRRRSGRLTASRRHAARA